MGHVTGDATRMRVLGNVGFLSSSGTVQDSVRGETRYLVYSSCLVVVTSRLYKLVYIRVVLKLIGMYVHNHYIPAAEKKKRRQKGPHISNKQ